jgi:lipopolysaccharide heptosyltransferase I
MPTASASKILIIRPTALGDVSRTVPCLVTLRQAYPDAQIDWLVHESFVDAVRHHPELNRVIPFARGKFGGLFKNPGAAADFYRWLSSLRASRYDLVVDLQGLFRSGFFTRVTAAKTRLGYANARELGWLFYNRKHTIDPSLHAVDRMLGLLEAEGYPLSHDMRLYTSPDDQAWAQKTLTDSGLDPQAYFVVAPTAKWLCKCWPVERYAQITRQLLDAGQAGSGCVILAAPNERPIVERMMQLVGQPAKVIAPATRVGQMMALIQNTRLLLCNDSAPLHVGVGFDRKIVTVFGPTDPGLVGPYRRLDTVIQPDEAKAIKHFDYRGQKDDQRLISQVTAETVWKKVLQTLG